MKIPEISVLMSVYNETLQELDLSLTSVLEQTFSDFECIVVVDKPDRIDAIDYIKDKMQDDCRIVLLINDNNIGLAMSMNKAASVAKGKYLARMDADDISILTRFERQYECMERNGYDLTCTSYYYIDESNDKLDYPVLNVTDEMLKFWLPYVNFISHPTVMMKKTVFDNVGGYRNFPCAQDYDLWLRLFDANISMHIISEQLLEYRIRPDSISQKTNVKQMLTTWYVQSLCIERKRDKKDTFSEGNYKNYLTKNHAFDTKYLKKAKKNKLVKDKIDSYRGKKKIIRVLLVIRLCCFSSFYRKYYIHSLSNKLGMLKIRLIAE